MQRINISEERTESRFLANMSHEIRTPMNSIMGFLELVLEDPELASHHRKNLETALHSSKNLLVLINNILDLSKIESSSISVASREFEFAMLISTLQAKWIAADKEKNISFSVECADSLSGVYLGDILIIEKIMSLLIENSIKFTEHGTVKLFVGPGVVKDTVLFALVDTGIGIHPSFLNEIFEPFTQGDSTNSRSYEGVGLGATIALKFAELLGGDILVESTYGEGSTFSVTLPLVNLAGVEGSKIDETGDREPRSARCFKILLVEDVETNLELARVHLHRRDQEVDVAKNGLEAIDQCELNEYDVILMDIHMPVMDGIEAMTRIRAVEGDVKHTIIIALTADIMTEVRVPLLEKGFDDVIGKPINFDDLMEILQDSLPAECGVVLEEKISAPLEVSHGKSVSAIVDTKSLIKEIYKKLDLYNPAQVEPLLTELAESMGENRYLRSISGLVSAFEFDRAVQEVECLADSLGIVLDKKDV